MAKTEKGHGNGVYVRNDWLHGNCIIWLLNLLRTTNFFEKFNNFCWLVNILMPIHEKELYRLKLLKFG